MDPSSMMQRHESRRGDLVVVGGLPGAGKSTLLAGMCLAGVWVLDSDHVRVVLRTMVPRWVPYAVFRPAVHLAHFVRIAAVAVLAKGPVVVLIPATAPVARGFVALAGACRGRRTVLLWLDVSAERALAGQRARGRAVSARSFARHVARAQRLRCRLEGGIVPFGYQNARVLSLHGPPRR